MCNRHLELHKRAANSLLQNLQKKYDKIYSEPSEVSYVELVVRSDEELLCQQLKPLKKNLGS